MTILFTFINLCRHHIYINKIKILKNFIPAQIKKIKKIISRLYHINYHELVLSENRLVLIYLKLFKDN